MKGLFLIDNRKYGYIRVSSKDQNEERQWTAMKRANIQARDIFIDKVSGKNFQREQYQLLKRMIRKGDIIYVHSLDRFGRNLARMGRHYQKLTSRYYRA